MSTYMLTKPIGVAALLIGALSSANALAEPPRAPGDLGKPKRTALVSDKPSPRGRKPPAATSKGACVKAPVVMKSAVDAGTFTLATCDGRPAVGAVEELSILARPGKVAKPHAAAAALAHVGGDSIAPGIKRVDPGLVVRLQKTVDHFVKPGETTHIVLVSGYRPTSSGSYHQRARALDFRIDGVKNEDLVAFCKTLDDTGCGYYPNSVFIHMDVREKGKGHIAWIDASGPGEPPRYVSSWPPPAILPGIVMPSFESPSDDVDDHRTVGHAGDGI
jgi:hypothetical protein